MRSHLMTATIVLVLLAGAGLYWRGNQNLEASSETTTQETKQVTIGSKTFLVELATINEQQTAGLSNRISLPQNQGMLFVFSPATNISFWMKDMKFGIDIIWIKDGKVTQINKGVPAPAENVSAQDLETYSTDKPVDYVLEVNAGEADEIEVGNDVTISEL